MITLTLNPLPALRLEEHYGRFPAVWLPPLSRFQPATRNPSFSRPPQPPGPPGRHAGCCAAVNSRSISVTVTAQLPRRARASDRHPQPRRAAAASQAAAPALMAAAVLASLLLALGCLLHLLPRRPRVVRLRRRLRTACFALALPVALFSALHSGAPVPGALDNLSSVAVRSAPPPLPPPPARPRRAPPPALRCPPPAHSPARDPRRLRPERVRACP